MASVTINQADIAKVQALLGDLKDKYKSVMTTSINKTLTTARTQATARIGNELNLKASRIKEDFTIQKANFGNISGALVAKGAPVGLINFSASQTMKGVSVKVLRSSSRTVIKHAYIGSKKGQTKQHVYWRKNRMPGTGRWPVGKKARAAWDTVAPVYRRPVERLTGPRIEDIFANPKVFDPVSIQAQHVYLQNVDAKIDDILRRHSG
jgi:hypothetical protein